MKRIISPISGTERNLSLSPDGMLFTNWMTDKSDVSFIVAERKKDRNSLAGPLSEKVRE